MVFYLELTRSLFNMLLSFDGTAVNKPFGYSMLSALK